VAWSTLTNSVSQPLISSSDLAGASPSFLPASTWYLQYSMTCHNRQDAAGAGEMASDRQGRSGKGAWG
jgi:hypothetical protein